MTRLARIVFVLLVAATFAAFFVAQRLKNAPSVAEITHVTPFFSPNGDGRGDVDRITFTAKQADRVTATIVDPEGDRVRRLAEGLEVRPGRAVNVVWDGRTDDGLRVHDGRYRLQLGLRRTGRSVVIPGSFNVDTTPPTPVVASVSAPPPPHTPPPPPRRGPPPPRRAGDPSRAPSRSASGASAGASRPASASCA